MIRTLHQVSEDLFLTAHAEQVAKGLAEYGKTLHPFNGRNAADDCRRELVDANDYLTQLEMERDTYKAHAEKMAEALYEIAFPIRAMERRADAEGKELNGAMAVHMSENAFYLQGIAQRAFKTYEEATK